MLYQFVIKALIAGNVPVWNLDSKDLNWVVEVQNARNGQPLKLIVNPRLNLDFYRAQIEDALRIGSFTYAIDVHARSYVIVH